MEEKFRGIFCRKVAIIEAKKLVQVVHWVRGHSRVGWSRPYYMKTNEERAVQKDKDQETEQECKFTKKSPDPNQPSKLPSRFRDDPPIRM